MEVILKTVEILTSYSATFLVILLILQGLKDMVSPN